MAADDAIQSDQGRQVPARGVGPAGHAGSPQSQAGPAEPQPSFPVPSTVPPVSRPVREDRAAAKRHMTDGDQLYESGQFHPAFVQYQHALRCLVHPACHFKLAMAAWRLGNSTLALTHLLETVRLDPRSRIAHEALSQRYLEDGNTDLALEHSRIAVSVAPNDPSAVISRGFVLAAVNQEQAAWELIQPMIAGRDTPPRAAILYGKIARAIGREAEALELVLALLDAGPPAGVQASSLHFVAAALLERRARYDEAFAHARRAHEAHRRPYDPSRNTQLTDGLIRYFTKSAVRSLPLATHGNSRPVFIVGLPRSGTSLVEQMLATHPAVHGAGELPTLQQIACDLNNPTWSEGEPFPACLEFLSIRRANQLADHYLSRLAQLDSSARFVTDKLPLNFRDLWLVQILFPQARVIHCVRDPRDTCLSCYMTDFAGGNEFSQGLSALGSFYRDYQRLMEHWGRVLDLPILHVPYEAVVEDTETQVRRMLEFLGLDWDERCLRFYENTRHVPTASNAQVRRPIYRSSVGRWRHYETHLTELLTALASN